MVVGWDIGGVNTKVAVVRDGSVVVAQAEPFELQRDPMGLVPLLRELASTVGAIDAPRHAVTMTAELSQMFRTKREGVAFVVDAIERAFPAADLRIAAVDGRFLTPDGARQEPLAVAAANWAATARAVAVHHPDALLIDVGTTTTDVVPIAGGRVAASGWTDPDRLASGELVYTGAVRTAVEAITSRVPYAGTRAGVSAEAFALSGDVHVWRGALALSDYSAPTPDGRPVSREYAGERLARVVCADREMLDDDAITAIADAIAAAQVERVAEAVGQVLRRHPALRVAVVTGVGAFIGEAAAESGGLQIVRLASELGDAAARSAPAAAVALLLARGEPAADRPPFEVEQGDSSLSVGELDLPADLALPVASPPSLHVEIVVKVGGGLLATIESLDLVLAAVARLALTRRVLVVAGGGPFADAVREVDRRIALGADAAHWMAVLGMDQYAHLLVARLPNAMLVTALDQCVEAFGAGQVPVLAASRWLAAEDPLPHDWSVTSDSIAAWVAGASGATDLVLVKPRGASGDVVDAYFERAMPAGVSATIVAAEDAPSALARLEDPHATR